MTFIQGESINRLTAEAPLCAILFGLGGISVMTFIQGESINRLTAEAPLCAIIFGLGGISVLTFIQGESINSGDMYSPVIITKYTINHKNCKPENNKSVYYIL
jgi:hypothetical protein